MQSLPVLFTGQKVMHSKLHFFELQLSLSRTAILCDIWNALIVQVMSEFLTILVHSILALYRESRMQNDQYSRNLKIQSRCVSPRSRSIFAICSSRIRTPVRLQMSITKIHGNFLPTSHRLHVCERQKY